MNFFSDCSGKCCVCRFGDGGCLAGHGDDEFSPATKEQLVQRLEKGEYPNYRDLIIAKLKEKET